MNAAIRRALEASAEALTLSEHLHAQGMAIRLLADEKAHRSRVRAKSASRREAAKATKSERQAASAAIREAVFLRAAGRCEVPGCSRPPDEWHHIASGSDRKLEEGEDTTVAICIPHHRLAQAGDRETLAGLLAWALAGLFTRAVRALERRIGKIDEARRSA